MTMDPFCITGPAHIGFSGGRTSAYLLHSVMQAHGGTLPADVVAIFTNTGREDERTLEFVEECSQRWSVSIVWLEYAAQETFRLVDFRTASRNGEPFAQMCRDRRYIPNPAHRVCTQQLKIKTAERYLLSCGWDEGWTQVVGVRADEPHRRAKLLGWETPDCPIAFPLYDAGKTAVDVDEFWCRQPFRLRTPKRLGNCDNCFLKDRGIRVRNMMERPESADFWISISDEIGHPFEKSDRMSYRELKQVALAQRHRPVEVCAPVGTDGLKRKNRRLERQPLLFIADGESVDEARRCYCGD